MVICCIIPVLLKCFVRLILYYFGLLVNSANVVCIHNMLCLFVSVRQLKTTTSLQIERCERAITCILSREVRYDEKWLVYVGKP